MNDDTILSPVNIIERKLSCKEEKLNKGCVTIRYMSIPSRQVGLS
jgi:hypothetical protein